MARKKNKASALPISPCYAVYLSLDQSADPDAEDDDIETSSICSSESNVSTNRSELQSNAKAIADLRTELEHTSMELMNPRPASRITALKSIHKVIQKFFLDLDSEPSVVNSISLNLESVFKKGVDLEKLLACSIICSIVVQVGPDLTESLLRNYKALLQHYVKDNSLQPSLRGSAAVALSVLVWQAPEELDPETTKEILTLLANVFKTACLKGDGKSPVHAEAMCNMQVDAISSWMRVLISAPGDLGAELGEAAIPQLVSILQNVNVNLRIEAAEALAIVFELIREEKRVHYQGPYYKQILIHLDDLISESSKAISKKDKKKQRTSLRPVLSSIRTQDHPEVRLKLGNEQLLLDTCVLNFYYESLCDVLAQSVNNHLLFNPYVRDMFDLGPPVKREDQANGENKESKAQRQFVHQIVSKDRHINRQYNRNKKASFQNRFDE
ncbi:Interferon- developmental regulator 1 [Cichlidogyrus casuarinus]|uniref:Interferon- developmental regulator 1 n=1 Tax=Cichlidogyrus casuarinus TaxID=1844966 RepID=A0ABD2Q089_9PLAT